MNSGPPSQLLVDHTPIPGLDGCTVGDFWRWAYSDILSNRNRSIFAEYIVGVALGVVDKPRVEWDAADLCYEGFKIEVKSSADCQSWHQEKPSTIQFSIRKAVFWNPATGRYEGEPTRCADVYVFCHYPERDKTKTNVLDVPAWDFYVVSTATLNQDFGEAKSLSLAVVKRVAVLCKFEGLKATVDQVAGTTEGASK
ncbi:MAG: hypothetical protein LC114_05790 [Bryobacterales bacterium]|nr:hypothetical protein [Bryobacterales bacterium]